MKYLFAGVYILVLITQLPHIWSAYASIERPDLFLAQWTAIGAAVAFELSTGVFTFRIVKGSRRRWTRRGLAFFIVASVVANAQYYGWLPSVFDWLWPIFATIALPLSLALFAHEFGAEVKRDERQAKREAKRQGPLSADGPNEPATGGPFTCNVCGVPWPSQNALAGHQNAHRKEKD